jgi:hypothetical protein
MHKEFGCRGRSHFADGGIKRDAVAFSPSWMLMIPTAGE